jgi:predicted Zn-dependent protease
METVMHLSHRARIGILAAIGLIGLSGCATNQMTGRSQLMMVSEKSAIAQSSSAYQSMIGSLEKKGRISDDAGLNTRIKDITDRLITQAVRYRPETRDWNWTIKVIAEPKTVNAFCMPGGRMGIYTGLVDKLEATDDELAQVMGHEISHALANHGAEKMSVQIASSVAVVAVTAAASRDNRNQQAVYNAAELAALAFINLPNSRTAEEEADRLGIELAARAGYHPHAAVTLWEKMMKESKSKSRIDFLSTHPAPPKRIDTLAGMEPAMLKLYDPDARTAAVAVAWTSRPANERAVDAGQASDGAASSLDGSSKPKASPLAFYSETFDRFSKGEAELKCDSCSAEFILKQGSLRELHDNKSWRQLALDTIKIGYGIDLAWYYLGVAAGKLGFPEASARYLAEALRLSAQKDTACAHALILSCGGIDIAREARR